MLKTTLIIPASGSSNRMGFNKITSPLFGKPVIAHTIELFSDIEEVEAIVLAVQPEMLEWIKTKIVEKYKLTKVKAIVAGGESRFDSVFNAYKAIEWPTDIIAIHDAARPFVSRTTVEEVIVAADKENAAIVTNHVIPTVKLVDKNGFISDTLNRNELRLAATPQAFKYTIYKSAIENYLKSSETVTDDAQLVELNGIKVTTIIGNLENIKLTTPFDWQIAEACGQKWLKKL